MAFESLKERTLRALGRDPVQAAAVRSYTALVDRARAPVFYEQAPDLSGAEHAPGGFGVPDTVEGRFDLLTLHMFLVLGRLKDVPGTERFAQTLFDVMFRNMDDSLREMGVGDMRVPKKIRQMAEEFYGRVGAYDAAMDDRSSLAAALSRNLYGTDDAPMAPALAAYVQDAAVALRAVPPERLTGGEVPLPDPAPRLLLEETMR